ncbi:iron-containing alcohol dehydrogenase, partial [Gemmiger formicilis]
AYALYSDIKPNPTIQNVQDGVAAFKAAEADCIVTIGGGTGSGGHCDGEHCMLLGGRHAFQAAHIGKFRVIDDDA